MLVGDDGGKRSGVHDRAEIPEENLPSTINLNRLSNYSIISLHPKPGKKNPSHRSIGVRCIRIYIA